METLFSIIAALQPQELITKIDLKDAYHHILVNHNIRKFFRFMISRKTCQFRVLLLGLSTVRREFTKMLALVVQLLRRRGIRVHANLHNLIIRADSPELCSVHAQETIHLLQSLGWTINWTESLLEPSHVMKFLGLHFNLKQALLSLPSSFLETLTSILSRLSSSSIMPARKITSINSSLALCSFHSPQTTSAAFSPVLDKTRLAATCSTMGQSNPTEPWIYFTSPFVLQAGSTTGSSWLELEAVCLAIVIGARSGFNKQSMCIVTTVQQWPIFASRGDTLSNSVPQDCRIVSTAEQVCINSCAYTSSRSTQRDHGCTVTTRQPQSYGMASTARDLKQSVLCLLDSANGHVRDNGNQGDANLRFTLPGWQGLGSRHPLHIVGRLRTDIRIPSSSYRSQDSGKNQNLSKNDSDTHTITTSVTAMAPTPVTTQCTPTHTTPGHGMNCSNSFQTTVSLSTTETHTCWIWPRGCYSGTSSNNYPKSIVEMAVDPLRDSSSNVYNSQWKSFAFWATTRANAKKDLSYIMLVEYLIHLFNENQQVNTIKVHWSAIASVLKY